MTATPSTIRIEEVTVLALDNPEIQFAVQFLVDHSALSDKVTFTVRDSMFGSGKVMVALTHPDLPIAAWSAGEQALWAFVASIAGTREINLRALADYFRGTEDSHRIVAAFVALMGDPE